MVFRMLNRIESFLLASHHARRLRSYAKLLAIVLHPTNQAKNVAYVLQRLIANQVLVWRALHAEIMGRMTWNFQGRLVRLSTVSGLVLKGKSLTIRLRKLRIRWACPAGDPEGGPGDDSKAVPPRQLGPPPASATSCPWLPESLQPFHSHQSTTTDRKLNGNNPRSEYHTTNARPRHFLFLSTR